MHTCLHGLHACLVLQIKLCMNTLISAPPWLEWSLAMNINLAFIALPDAPTWHKRESAFCLCQRLARSSAQLLHPASLPQGHRQTVCDVSMSVCGSCLRQQKEFLASSYRSSCEHQTTKNPYVMWDKKTRQKLNAINHLQSDHTVCTPTHTHRL